MGGKLSMFSSSRQQRREPIQSEECTNCFSELSNLKETLQKYQNMPANVVHVSPSRKTTIAPSIRKEDGKVTRCKYGITAGKPNTRRYRNKTRNTRRR